MSRRAPIWGAVVALDWVLGWLTSWAAGVELASWSLFGSTGAWTFQLATGITLAWILRRGRFRTPHVAPVI